MSNADCIKTCLLSEPCSLLEHVFSGLANLFDVALRVVCPIIQGPVPNPESGEIPVILYTHNFSSNPPVYLNIYLRKCQSSIKRVKQKVHMCLRLHKYSRPPEYIKNNISNKVMPAFEVGKLLTMNYIYSKRIQVCYMANMTHFINRK